MSYLGHVETMGDQTTVQSFLAAAPNRSRESLASIFSQKAANTAGHRSIKVADATIEKSGTLSLAGILRMCSSLAYRDEWQCTGYELPAICTASTSQRARHALKEAEAAWMRYVADKYSGKNLAIEAERRAMDEVAHAVVRYLGATDDSEAAVRGIPRWDDL